MTKAERTGAFVVSVLAAGWFAAAASGIAQSIASISLAAGLRRYFWCGFMVWVQELGLTNAMMSI
jgi:hypothetical protein